MVIHYLSTRRHDYTFREFLDGAGAGIAAGFRQVAYEDVLQADPDGLPGGTWIFTDYDRLTAEDSAKASRIWQHLADRGCRMLNHPTRSLRRFALLRALHDRGINDFDAYTIDEGRVPKRFPVFIRRADAHSGPASRLLADQAALDRTIGAMRRIGLPLHSFIVVEFQETRSADGFYRKHGMIKVGDRLVPIHLLTTPEWMVRSGKQVTWDDAAVASEVRFVSSPPHRERIEAIFAIAGIDFGRIDYALSGERIQVWEINTNPSFFRRGLVAERRRDASAITNAQLVAAFADLAPADGRTAER